MPKLTPYSSSPIPDMNYRKSMGFFADQQV